MSHKSDKPAKEAIDNADAKTIAKAPKDAAQNEVCMKTDAEQKTTSAQNAAQSAATQAMMAFMGGAAPVVGETALKPVGSDLEALENPSE